MSNGHAGEVSAVLFELIQPYPAGLRSSGMSGDGRSSLFLRSSSGDVFVRQNSSPGHSDLSRPALKVASWIPDCVRRAVVQHQLPRARSRRVGSSAILISSRRQLRAMRVAPRSRLNPPLAPRAYLPAIAFPRNIPPPRPAGRSFVHKDGRKKETAFTGLAARLTSLLRGV